MENFVLYDELGRGEQRIVYKGRKKGTIEYLAIHCVEKSKREELQNNVRICHDLLHKNIVQFHEWYETSNHLWLVVELCTGLNLETILMQDGNLPEKTIKGFGRDIIEALFYLHCRDIIYCDLVPSKMVLDGTGILKLSNFTLAKFEGETDHLDEEHADFDLEQSMLGRENLSKRVVLGLPFYTAPEILTGGYHTKLSDFWSLGCLLYECYTGSPPYVATKLDDLLEKIQSEEIPCPVQEKDNKICKASKSFYSLIHCLLAKDPQKRIGWQDLCSHDFWEGSLLYILGDIEKVNMIYEELAENSNEQVTKQADLSRSDLSSSQNQQFEHNKIDSVKQENTLVYDSLNQPKEVTDSLNKGLLLREEIRTHEATKKFFSKDKTKYSSLRESKKKSDLNASLKQSQLEFAKPGALLDQEINFGPNLNLVDLLYHPSDLEVSPIIENPKIQKQSVFKWDTHNIPFPTLKLDNIEQLPHEQIDSHIITICEFFEHIGKGSKASGGIALRAKTHSLSYLCSLSKFDKIANSLIEKDFARLLLSELKGHGSQDLKIRAAKLLGILACSATYISSNFKMTEAFVALTEALRDNLCVLPLKTALLPALGEFMFYAATQEEGEDKRISNWDPPGAMFTIVSRCLQPGEDVLVQHFAAKIVENIVTTAGRYCKKFLTKEIGFSLWNLFSHSVTDAEKVTSSSALCRLSMNSNAIILQVMEKIGVDSLCKALLTGTNSIQQSLLTVIITLLSNPTYFKRISQDTNVIQKTVRILESSSLTLRGKVYLFIAEISMKSYDALLDSLKAKVITFIERDSKKTSAGMRTDVQAIAYSKKCLELAVGNIMKQVPLIMSGILNVIDTVIGRHHPSATQIKQLRSNMPYLSILLHIVTSQVFRPRAVNDSFIEALGSLLNFVQTVDTGKTNLSSSIGDHAYEDITRTIFSIVEAITQHPLLLLEYRMMFITNILPHLSSFCCSSSGDTRMWATKMFSDVATLYFEKDDCDKSSRGKNVDSGKLLQIINDTFVQNIDAFLQDQDPIPAYSLKILQSYVDHDKDSAKHFIENGLVIGVLELFDKHQDDTRSSTLVAIINFIASITSACGKDLTLICKQELIDYLMSAFIAASAVLEEDETGENASMLFLPLLDTLRQVLRSLEAQVKRVVRSKEDASKVRSDKNQDIYNVELFLQRCKIISELNGVLITLLCFDDEEVQEYATHCLYISAELFGGEYEASFSEDNLECLIDAIQLSNHKRKKLLLRIVKRFITSNDALLRILHDNGEDLHKYLTELIAADSTSTEMKSVQVAAHEILRLIKTID